MIYEKPQNYKYVDDLPKDKINRTMKFFGECTPAKLTKIIADTILIHGPYRIGKSGVNSKSEKLGSENRKRANPCCRIHPSWMGYNFRISRILSG